MENEKQQISVSENLVACKVYNIRDRRVILDRDLAELYEVETRVLLCYQESLIVRKPYK